MSKTQLVYILYGVIRTIIYNCVKYVRRFSVKVLRHFMFAVSIISLQGWPASVTQRTGRPLLTLLTQIPSVCLALRLPRWQCMTNSPRSDQQMSTICGSNTLAKGFYSKSTQMTQHSSSKRWCNIHYFLTHLKVSSASFKTRRGRPR